MKILVFNQSWCVEEWRAAGHDVRTVGFSAEFDVPNVPPLLHVNTILETYLPGFSPDRIVFWDNSAPISVLGLDDIQIPTFFYSVDAHHHVDYHKYLAHVFDSTFVAQRDYIDDYRQFCENPRWMPLWTSRLVEASNEKKFGAVFVGNMNPDLNPGRVAFFEKLKKIRDVHTTMGEYWKIFPHAQVVVNQTVKGDLNFRVFETLMCGVPLLTEKSANGLFEIFKDGHHLLTYEKDNVDQAAEMIDFVLTHPKEAAEIAHAGREEVLRAHLPTHRAATVMTELLGLRKQSRLFKHFAMFINFSVLARRMEKLNLAYASKALLHALQLAESAKNSGEPITTELACHCILSSTSYDRLFKSNAGQCLIESLSEAYPQEKVLHLSRIRSRLNMGDMGNARGLAETYFDDAPQQTFKNAEIVVGTILSELMG